MENTAYIFFYLLGIPLWLVPPILIARCSTKVPVKRAGWVLLAFASPLIAFTLGAMVQSILVKVVGPSAAWAGAFAYFGFGVSLLGFFAPLCLLLVFRSKNVN